jgi:plastocyanin
LIWDRAVVIGAASVILSIVGAMVLIIEGVIAPMAGFAVVVLIGVGVFSRHRAIGAKALAVIAVLSLAATVPFAIESLLLVESSVDFSLNLLSITGAILLLVASVAAARDREGDADSRGARAAVVLFLLVMIAGVGVSATLRLLRDDPLGRPGDVTVYAEDIEFSPVIAHAEAGRVTIFLENKDLTAHTFTVDRLDVDEVVPGGGSSRIVFDAEPGSYEFVCSIAGHEEMTGTLEIGGSV